MLGDSANLGSVKVSRWRYVIASVVINLCLGAVYAFSFLVPPLEQQFGWKRIETSPAFTIALLTFALSMIPAGRLQDKKGPKAAASLGGLLLGWGMILSSFTDSLASLYISYGLIAGLGIGFAYGAPIATCTKWFPDKKGLATGLVVFGFGGGAIIFAPFWAFMIGACNWSSTFLVTGLLFMALAVSAAQVLRNPRPDYKPAGWSPPVKSAAVREDLEPAEMVRTPAFFLMWVTYWLGTTAGLMTIGQAKLVAMELAHIEPDTASLAVSILGGFNAAGRLMWGFLGDRVEREKMLIADFAICFVALIILSTIFEPLIFIIGLSLVGLCFGGFLALYPALTSDRYGAKNLGINYGIVFTAYGGGSVLGPTMASYFRTFHGSYLPAFYIAAVLALTGVLVTFLLKKG